MEVEVRGTHGGATATKGRTIMPFALFEAYVAGEVGQLQQRAGAARRRLLRWPR